MSIENISRIALAVITISLIFISIKWVKPHVSVAFFVIIEIWWAILALCNILSVVMSYISISMP